MVLAADLGFEYLNLKEKCATPAPDDGTADSCNTFLLTCSKDHSHWREVSVHGRVDAPAVDAALWAQLGAASGRVQALVAALWQKLVEIVSSLTASPPAAPSGGWLSKLKPF